MHAEKKAVRWALQILKSLEYTPKNSLPEEIQHTPWSYVVRFETLEGYIYLKQTPPQLALEANIIQVLHDQFHVSTPAIIASNEQLHCFLMKDAGFSLRKILKKTFDGSLLCRAINEFASLQIAVSEHIEVLLNIGVPDWRLNHFPDLYQAVILQKDLLIADGLSEIEIDELDSLIPKISQLCEKLSLYCIKPTLVQPDCNDNNTLIDDTLNVLTLIDLGEIAISHPFFSLLNFLYQIKKHHGLTEENEAFIKIKNAYLTPYLTFKSEENLLKAFSIAQKLWMVYGILAHHRLILACDKEKIMSALRGRLSNAFKELRASLSCV